ncbi:hypothetical protein [Roseimaritima ulvae]|uniref:Uncharacterized protein n=1 Tax=Roseimaritima ulvae TaxID=980254 RepID=A0A5B9QZU3_9BACT|nr:hypothetical protein [Roseimaritima ulvae]QEG43450.1 hypothetical protein UC8_54990 [Roseimaritima ulvae]
MRNEEATAGDQLGLFGDATAKPRKLATFGNGQAIQRPLLDGLDALPGQMSLIDEAGAPESMVYESVQSTPKKSFDASANAGNCRL